MRTNDRHDAFVARSDRDVADVLALLSGVVDPEIPVLNVVELGIIRGVDVAGEAVEVRITPTYSGCPAMHAITEAIDERLRGAGFASVRVERVLDEAWTTDWMADEAREKLRRYGIAPPGRAEGAGAHGEEPVACPRCGTQDTELRSVFGSTACKALHYCRPCAEPFEAFKCL